jgi:hypothetical protein
MPARSVAVTLPTAAIDGPVLVANALQAKFPLASAESPSHGNYRFPHAHIEYPFNQYCRNSA